MHLKDPSQFVVSLNGKYIFAAFIPPTHPPTDTNRPSTRSLFRVRHGVMCLFILQRLGRVFCAAYLTCSHLYFRSLSLYYLHLSLLSLLPSCRVSCLYIYSPYVTTLYCFRALLAPTFSSLFLFFLSSSLILYLPVIVPSTLS